MVTLAGELFAQKGYRATTVREIADAAGILSGSLYHHFDSKESIGDEILSGFMNEVLADYRAAVASARRPARRAGADRALDQRHPVPAPAPRWRCCRTTGVTSPSSRGSPTCARRCARSSGPGSPSSQQGIEAGVFRADLDPKLTYRLVRDVLWMPAQWRRDRRLQHRAGGGRASCACSSTGSPAPPLATAAGRPLPRGPSRRLLTQAAFGPRTGRHGQARRQGGPDHRRRPGHGQVARAALRGRGRAGGVRRRARRPGRVRRRRARPGLLPVRAPRRDQRGGLGGGRGHRHRGLRPARRAGQQRGRAEVRQHRRDAAGRVPADPRGQRGRLLAGHEGGDRADEGGGRRVDRQHLLDRGLHRAPPGCPPTAPASSRCAA